jgi:outer membrane protein OmpA-like peptidoglycan-associated protein/LysM repeat protein
MYKRNQRTFILIAVVLSFLFSGCAQDRVSRRENQIKELQEEFSWWPTDAKPAPVKDEEKGGYWWWPTAPGEVKLWGNRGYIYVYKIIFDYKSEELPAPKPKELRPSLLIKKIIKNVKIYFDYNKANLRDDAVDILKDAVRVLSKNPDASILITGNCDIRGSEAYNEKLGRKRAEAIKKFMLDEGISEDRIRIVSRGKLDAIAPVSDLVGMQKDRNAQFMIAEVEEIMLPYTGGASGEMASSVQETSQPATSTSTQEKKVVEEKQEIESQIKVSTKEYTVKKGDSLWGIAEKEMGNGYRWKYLYELNKDRIKNPNRLKAGTKIIIPVE